MMKKINIKVSSNIYLWWNFGSNIFIFMMIQIFIGILISMNYFLYKNIFFSSFNIYYNNNYGWLKRTLHSNLTSLIFILIYIHMMRSIFFNSNINFLLWLIGMILFLILMMNSFIGYSLIWTQMSYWGMMVITNFISLIPKFGIKILILIWGNFNINNILINRFFSLHFIFSFLLIFISFIHIYILHLNKSNNPLGIFNKMDMLNLNFLMLIKDFILMLMIYFMLLNLIFYFPLLFNNFDNFNMMNYFKTPLMIEPEWYFLFFYSILRSIYNKYNGLLLIFLIIIMFIFLPKFFKFKFQSNKFNFIHNYLNLIIFNLMIYISLMSKFNMNFFIYMYNLILINMFIYMWMFYFILFKFLFKFI